MAKNRNKSRNQPQNQPKQNTNVASQPQQKPVTKDDLSSSNTKDEFEKTKQQLLKQAEDELKIVEEMKAQEEESLKKIRQDIEMENANLAKIREEKEPLEKDIETQREELAKIEADKKKAEEKARTVLDEAKSKGLKIVEDAEKMVTEEQREIVRKLMEKRADLNSQKEELDSLKIELLNKKNDFEYDKEALEVERAHTQKQRERYNEASPEKIGELELALNDAKKESDLLRGKYNEQTEKYHQAQLTLDDIKTDAGGSIKSLLLEHKELKERNEELERIHEKYPTEESIEELEKAKKDCETLNKENEELDRERRLYKDETLANQSALRELENIKSRADATTTLNDHLLKELESHKTALESRTGDTCPALTKVDSEVEGEEFYGILKKRDDKDGLSNLKDIVSHVKNYAGSRTKEEQLYYKDDDIRAFLAGMAVSRLIILQGMSGTGKSSLPRIFSESISGFNRLIPVESSWRDRNELLGYYNDFNKKFNAKTFTIELYRSGKKECHMVPTFIVLDEMNLSRIEYYFSDFLAVLQETNPKNWLIELVSNDMRTLPMDIPVKEKNNMPNKDHSDIYSIWERFKKSQSGELETSITDEEKTRLADYLEPLGLLTGAKDLINGRKVRVSKNVWFVGTANRDESTFEITDKVYDRAQVISLDEKGEQEKNYISVNQKKIDIGTLLELFKEATDNFDKVKDVEERLTKLDNFLIKKFAVSFGNRIVRQTIDFAAVFVAAGGKLTDALDYQISTKILRKVISSDNRGVLEEFEILADENNYQKTAQMISKRLKNLG
jgi:hypothetical protein